MITLNNTFRILNAVGILQPRRCSSREIAAACGLGLRTTQRFLVELEQVDLLNRDNGNPSGWAITKRGKEMQSIWQEGQQ